MFSTEQYPQVDIISLTVQMKKPKNRELQIYLTNFVQLKNKRKKKLKREKKREEVINLTHKVWQKFSLRA